MPREASEDRRSVPCRRRSDGLVDPEGRTLRILDDREAAGVRNVLRTVHYRSAEGRRQPRRLIDVVGFDVRHPVRRNALLALVGTQTEEARERDATVGPHCVVLIERLRTPTRDRRIELPRSVDVGRRELVPNELTVHGSKAAKVMEMSRSGT